MKTTWRGLLALLATVLSGALVAATACSSAPPRSPRSPSSGKAPLSVMTYNLNYGLAGDENTLKAIADHPADLVLLQEATPEWESAILSRLGGRYPYAAFRHCCLAGGLGILSKYPFDDVEYIEPPPGGWFPAWRIAVATPLGRLQVLNVHLRPQVGDSGPNVGGVLSGMVTTPPIRYDEIGVYLGRLERGVPTLIAGDFNESEEGSAIERLQREGYISALPEFSSADTWRWRVSLVGKITRRFDHIVYSEELEPLSAGVVHAGRSDHLPVVAVFERR